MNVRRFLLLVSGGLGAVVIACSSTDHATDSATVQVTGVTPDHGSARGGDTIVIAGAGFGTSPVVRFGAAAATVRTATGDHLEVVAPRGSAGAVDIDVQAGEAHATLGHSFTYDAQSLSFVDVSWRNTTPYLASGAGIASGDANGDGHAEVFQAAGTEGVLVYANDGSGKLAAPKLVTLPAGTDAQAVAAADFDGDGKLDLYVGTGSGTPNVLLLGDGHSGFTVSTTTLPPLVGTKETLAVGDLDGDGDPDLVLVGVGATTKDPPQIAVLENDHGTFTDITKRLAGGAFAATGVALGDIDGDGDLDLFFGADAETSRLYVNDGKGTFQHASPDALPTSALHAGVPAMGDLDGDGDLDIYVPSSGQDHYLTNDGKGVFSDVSTQRLGQDSANGASALLADFDMDGRLDVAVVDRTGQLRLYRNDASNRLFDYSDRVVGQASGVVNAGASAVDIDGDGDLDLVASRADLSPLGLLFNAAPIAEADRDGDGVPDTVDDCPDVADPSQDNLDSLPMHCYSGASCKQGTGCTLYARGSSTYLVCPDAQTWNDAEARCRLFDAHLATIEDAEESAYVGKIGGTEALIGLSLGTSWTWAATGEKATFFAWAKAQPDGVAGQPACARILPDGTWDDVPCAEKRGYVCETARAKTPDPGDACDPCPSNYDPAQPPTIGPDAGADTDAAACKSVN